jgi:hypothetical protein
MKTHVKDQALFVGLTVILATFAIAKALVLYGDHKILSHTEILTEMTYRDFYILEITADLFVVSVLCMSMEAAYKHATILAFVSAGLMFHSARAILKIPEPCGCLGGISSIFPWIGKQEGHIAVTILLGSGVWSALGLWKNISLPSAGSVGEVTATGG